MPIFMDSPELNYIVVAGVPSPGRCRIQGADRGMRWEVREGPGIIGTMQLRGIKLAQFTVSIDMWTQEHLLAWEAFLPLLFPPPVPGSYSKVERTGIGISHPILAANGISAVVTESAGQVTKSSNGVWTSDLKFIEWRAPIAIPMGKVKRSVPAASGETPIRQTEGDRALAEEKLRAQAAEAKARGGTSTGKDILF